MATLPEIFASASVLDVAGDPPDAHDERFAFLYAHHAPRIHRFLRDLLGDAALAADATQETFARAYRQREAMRDRERAVPWLFGIARNVSLEARRARARASRVFVSADAEGRAPASPEGDLLGREVARVVAVALEKLSEERRAMLLLRLDHDLSYEQIAAAMGCSLAKAKVEIHRAREVLRATIEEYRRGAVR